MTDAKSRLAALPGVMVVHRLVKNLRYYLNSKKPTTGGVRRADMSVDDATRYALSIFAKVDALVGEAGGWSGKRVLEVGPGDSLATGLLCLAHGAAAYCAVDRFAVGMNLDFERQVFGKLFAAMPENQQAACREIMAALEAGSEFTSGRFIYRNNLPIESAPDDPDFGTHDVIFSNAVLEHVGDLPATLKAFSRLLNPDGTMFHDVDLRSHQTYESHPLQFLEYPQWLWKLMSSHNGEPNRVRLPQYQEILKEVGFGDARFEVTEAFAANLVQRVQPRLDRAFQGLTVQELEPATFRISVQR